MSAPAAARKEGRLYEGHDVMKVEQAGDQCTLGCNFDTKRPLRDILAIYKAVLGHGFSPRAMQDGDCALPSCSIGPIGAANRRMATCARALAATAYTGLCIPAEGLRAVLEDLPG